MTIGHDGGNPGVLGAAEPVLPEDTSVAFPCNFGRGVWPASQFICDRVDHDERPSVSNYRSVDRAASITTSAKPTGQETPLGPMLQ